MGVALDGGDDGHRFASSAAEMRISSSKRCADPSRACRSPADQFARRPARQGRAARGTLRRHYGTQVRTDATIGLDDPTGPRDASLQWRSGRQSTIRLSIAIEWSCLINSTRPGRHSNAVNFPIPALSLTWVDSFCIYLAFILYFVQPCKHEEPRGETSERPVYDSSGRQQEQRL